MSNHHFTVDIQDHGKYHIEWSQSPQTEGEALEICRLAVKINGLKNPWSRRGPAEPDAKLCELVPSTTAQGQINTRHIGTYKVKIPMKPMASDEFVREVGYLERELPEAFREPFRELADDVYVLACNESGNEDIFDCLRGFHKKLRSAIDGHTINARHDAIKEMERLTKKSNEAAGHYPKVEHLSVLLANEDDPKPHLSYNIIIMEDADGFSVTVPGLKGCFSQGDTKEEAMANIREAIACYRMK